MSNERTYIIEDSIVFRRTKEKYGGLSNMCAGYPIKVNNLIFLTSEALYQSLRYPFNPEVQQIIIDQKSPMTAKMKSKKYREYCRSDWNRVRVTIMRWCIRAKLICNWDKFGELLESTYDLPIVEYSIKDSFWGACPNGRNSLVGWNVLGRLLMELREDYRKAHSRINHKLKPATIDHFMLMGSEIGNIINIGNNSYERKENQISLIKTDF